MKCQAPRCEQRATVLISDDDIVKYHTGRDSLAVCHDHLAELGIEVEPHECEASA